MILIGSLAGLLLLFYIITRNGLIAKKNDVENSFSTIDVMLKKRYDLIPNLVSTVKEYMTYESETLEKIISLREKATKTNNSEEKINLNNQLGQELSALKISFENYPDLKADSSFQTLQKSLNEIEEQLQASRRTFNASVTAYNNAVEMFPSSIVASSMNYKVKELFKATETERKNVDVDNLFNK